MEEIARDKEESVNVQEIFHTFALLLALGCLLDCRHNGVLAPVHETCDAFICLQHSELSFILRLYASTHLRELT